MIRFDVQLETRLFDSLRSAAEAADGDVQLMLRSLEGIVQTQEVFGPERHLILQDLETWFQVGPMVSSPTFWAKQESTRAYIEQNLHRSVDAISPFLPTLPAERAKSLTVHLIPGFAKCYGPTEGIQIFALRAGAEPAEALLFLIHVYYHEVSSLFYTQTSRRAAESPDTAGLLKHWLLLLIQNEGLANYPVLESVLDLRAQGLPFAYFTYAGLVRDATAISQSMTVCREILCQLNDESFPRLVGHVFDILKNPGLPVINLVGIHLAEAIAERFGERVLLAVVDREPQEFFRMYSETGDPLCPYLFGPHEEAKPAFGLLRSGPLSLDNDVRWDKP